MTPVYQTIIDKGNGNCWQAVIASLFDLKLEEVPHFLSYKDDAAQVFFDFLKSKNYIRKTVRFNKNYASLGTTRHDCWNVSKWHRPSIITPNCLKNEPGINGYFYAGVFSPNNFSFYSDPNATHAVVIDKNFNIVHDPNLNYLGIRQYPLAHLLKYNGIIDISIINPIK